MKKYYLAKNFHLKRKEETRRLTIQLTAAAYNRLQELAHQNDRSLSWLINQAVEDYLKLKEEKRGQIKKS